MCLSRMEVLTWNFHSRVFRCFPICRYSIYIGERAYLSYWGGTGRKYTPLPQDCPSQFLLFLEIARVVAVCSGVFCPCSLHYIGRRRLGMLCSYSGSPESVEIATITAFLLLSSLSTCNGNNVLFMSSTTNRRNYIKTCKNSNALEKITAAAVKSFLQYTIQEFAMPFLRRGL